MLGEVAVLEIGCAYSSGWYCVFRGWLDGGPAIPTVEGGGDEIRDKKPF